ncbi:MAG: shikimate kinase [Deltaproteobacteria bacterium]|nr:shikimate kinase [Deltaproteobacteria bacterium]
METIWIVGMMGAGKSAVGRVLARMLKTRLVDTDEVIAREAGVSIPEIFEKEGEAGFRARELRAVKELSTRPQIVSLGGGALTQADLKSWVREHGTLVYLRADPYTLLRRVGDGSSRPLLANLSRDERLQRIRDLLGARENDYAAASVIIDTDRKRPRTVALELLDHLRERGTVNIDVDDLADPVVKGST